MGVARIWRWLVDVTSAEAGQARAIASLTQERAKALQAALERRGSPTMTPPTEAMSLEGLAKRIYSLEMDRAKAALAAVGQRAKLHETDVGEPKTERNITPTCEPTARRTTTEEISGITVGFPIDDDRPEIGTTCPTCKQKVKRLPMSAAERKRKWRASKA